MNILYFVLFFLDFQGKMQTITMQSMTVDTHSLILYNCFIENVNASLAMSFNL